MPREVQIALFWLVVYAGLWYLRKNPESIAARIAFSWHGPYPQHFEKKSSYYWRKALFAVGWLVQLLLAASILAIVAWLAPGVKESETFLLVATFALTTGAGMASLGALLACLTSFKARTFGPDPEFQPQEPSHAAPHRDA